MTNFAHLSDLQLEAACEAAREKAHNAPRNLFRNHDGTTSLGNSDAWARFANEWMQIKSELERRKKCL